MDSDRSMTAQEYLYVRHKVLKLTGVDLDCYRSNQMQRRLQAYLSRSGHANWPTFFRAIQDDPVALDKFKTHLTINVSYFFRDPDKYQYLQTVVLPELLHTRPNLQVWSAGCSYGQEPYSLVMALAELSSPYRPHRIVATDIDQPALDRARAGGPYTSEEITHVPALLRDRYFSQREGVYWFTHALQRRIVFASHNLLAEPFTPPPFEGQGYDLVVCRNVVIYFTVEGKDKLYRNFHKALRPGGVLFVGGTEIIPKAVDMGFDFLSMSFYRRRVE